MLPRGGTEIQHHFLSHYVDEKLLSNFQICTSIPNKVPRKKRVFLGPLSRRILKLSNWEITGEFPNYKKIILIGVPHTANRDAWYALLAILALDLKINFFGARWIFTRLPSPYTFSKDVDRLGIPWPLGWLQKIILLKLGGIPVYRNKSKGLIKGAIEEFSKMEEYVLAIAPEAGTEQVKKFRSGFYFLAKEMEDLDHYTKSRMLDIVDSLSNEKRNFSYLLNEKFINYHKNF